jgi:pimeloyl-ACP methyl ester carboxylesterase
MKWMSPLVLSLMILSGCAEEDAPDSTVSQAKSFGSDRYGKAFYLDGAGNLGFGVDTVPQGLQAAGFKGSFQPIIWTTFTGPIGDQVIRLNARLRSDDLTKKIIQYRRSYPEAPVYVIGLSAGTGVAVFALENLPDGVNIDTLVLLGSSLSSTYNMSKALKHVKTKVYVLHSPNDAVLSGFIPVTGTIDGAYLVEPAGLVGLRPAAGLSAEQLRVFREKVVNVAWRPSFERYGYAGGHTDATNFSFVKWYIARELLHISAPATTQTAGKSGTPGSPALTGVSIKAD